MSIPRIAITPGEPAGIGPDICILICQHDWSAELIFIVDPQLIKRRAELLGITLNIVLFDALAAPKPHQAGSIMVLPIPLGTTEKPGQLDTRNAAYVVNTLTKAALLCTNKTAQALVTGPVQKSIINDAGVPFTGHTEFLANYCQAYPVMMLASDDFRVALATTHLPLKEISDAITPELLDTVISILHRDLQDKFSIDQPKIAVCGLNPHAGENGHLGQEEINTITPALNKLRDRGILLTGPLPADTIFNPTILKQHDAVLAMYHDQGLPTLKYASFGRAVNITLGLTITRTSVDHGTALSLAGSGKSDPNSLKSALQMAINLSTDA